MSTLAKGAPSNLPSQDQCICEACLDGKMARTLFLTLPATSRAAAVLDIVVYIAGGRRLWGMGQVEEKTDWTNQEKIFTSGGNPLHPGDPTSPHASVTAHILPLHL